MKYEIFTKTYSTPVGLLFGGATKRGIAFLEFSKKNLLSEHKKKNEKKFNAVFPETPNGYLDILEDELNEYFAKKRKNFDIPLDIIKGTDFQRAVWKILLKIPYGKTVSYQKQAEMLGNIKAVRAVANANGTNSIVILIPCHRVIGKNGSLTGFGGGLWRKELLLNIERETIRA
jgi:AraC family transcriptional regulator of adaptative response/methylated-DNA-[protein]-cysteine methyltransferase